MKKICIYLSIFYVFAFITTNTAGLFAKEPVKIIFDTDMGNDVDDALALAVAHSLQSRGEIQILAVTTTKDNPYAAPMCDVINTFYGRGNIPIGVVKNGVTKEDGKYNRQVVELKAPFEKLVFHRSSKNAEDYPEAVSLLRQILAEQDDQSVVIVQIGFFTNLCRLLDTQGDEYSPLNGKDLVIKKVKYASIMAGAFVPRLAKHREYNVVCDLPSARKMIEHWPTEIIFSGFEIGEEITYPPVSVQEDFEYVPVHPLKEAYRFYRGIENWQPTFDLNSVLYVARPNRGYFNLSEPCRVNFNEQGETIFEFEPNGKHRFQIVNETQKAVIREALTQLSSQPPQYLVNQ